MSQKYPASVCFLSSFWTTVPPCCVCSLHYTSVCCERRICKISRSVAHWREESICCAGPWSLAILRTSLAHPVSIPLSVWGCFLRGSCRSQALLLWVPGLSAAAIRPNDAAWSRAGNAHGMSHATDPCWPGRALGSQAPAFCRGLCFVAAVLQVPRCLYRDPPLLCCCREEGRC